MQICGPLGGGKTAYPDICKSVEAIASSKLAHPNIVKALRHCTILAHGAHHAVFDRFVVGFLSTLGLLDLSQTAHPNIVRALWHCTILAHSARTLGSGVSGCVP